MTSRPKMLVNLQALRFLAALPVLAYHIAPHIWASGIPRGGWLHYNHLAGFGGVDIFFVISGFIMWHTTRDDRGLAAAWRFLRKRAARLYSGYWPFLLLSALLWYRYHPDLIPIKNWPLSTTLIPNPTGTTVQLDPGQLALPVSWTLVYEVYFYIGFAALVAFRRHTRVSTVLAILGVVVLAGIYAVYSGVFMPGRLLDSSLAFTLYLSPFCVEFLLGCLLGEWYRRRAIRWPLAWLAFGLAMAVLIGWVNARWFAGNLLLGYYIPQRVLLFSAAACGFVLWAVGLDQRGKAFLPRASLILGGSSYALYLSHTLWLQWFFDIGGRDWLARNGLTVPGYWLAALAMIIMAAAFYQFAERPLHRGFRRVLRA